MNIKIIRAHNNMQKRLTYQREALRFQHSEMVKAGTFQNLVQLPTLVSTFLVTKCRS